MKRWLGNVIIELDRLLNVLILFGRKRQSLSARAYEAMQKGKRWGCLLCRLLDRIDPDHCRKAANQ